MDSQVDSIIVRENAPQLPYELVDQVLRNLKFCPDTLLTCSLVSHTWLGLSRSIMFSSIFLIPYSDKDIRAFTAPTISPYVRDIELLLVINWDETDVLSLLPKFPGLNTLRLRSDWGNFVTVVVAVEAQARSRKSRSVTTILKRALGAIGSLIGWNQLFGVTEPKLTNLRTVYLDYPWFNVQVLAAISPPALDTLYLTLHWSDSDPLDSLYQSLRAAGAGLRALVLSLHQDLCIRRPPAPLATNLRALRLCGPDPFDVLVANALHMFAFLLDAPQLEELVIEATDGSGIAEDLELRGELALILERLPALRTLRVVRSCNTIKYQYCPTIPKNVTLQIVPKEEHMIMKEHIVNVLRAAGGTRMYSAKAACATNTARRPVKMSFNTIKYQYCPTIRKIVTLQIVPKEEHMIMKEHSANRSSTSDSSWILAAAPAALILAGAFAGSAASGSWNLFGSLGEILEACDFERRFANTVLHVQTGGSGIAISMIQALSDFGEGAACGAVECIHVANQDSGGHVLIRVRRASRSGAIGPEAVVGVSVTQPLSLGIVYAVSWIIRQCFECRRKIQDNLTTITPCGNTGASAHAACPNRNKTPLRK
ncbi:hypothetical protein GGX14DRAFT_605848 [Mycena pura]|uniref:F-box domain-containing protein n=1 Tax=Mycena pura TaxID=153505 RepID=A0AAD6ULY4_9AGAR|nr:hypothetical protein GGX14DRAFT_605848 [Mycena pura]